MIIWFYYSKGNIVVNMDTIFFFEMITDTLSIRGKLTVFCNYRRLLYMYEMAPISFS